MLNNPGMRPSIDAGAGRLTPDPKIDIFRRNWWCSGAAAAPHALNAPLALLYQGQAPTVTFFSEAERTQTRAQRERLDQAPAAATLMARQAVQWAEAHPGDSRVPQSLRLAVRAVRYACGHDAQTDQWVKRAFRLLHTRYAKTDAARRTPYWYSQ